jgi:hypothetical protein
VAASIQERVYTLLRRLSIGRILRYLDLWGRYVLRRALSAISGRHSHPGSEAGTLVEALREADFTTAKRLTVGSWFPLDRSNTRLHQVLLRDIATARPDLGLESDTIECLMRLKTASQLSAAVDAEVEGGALSKTVNTALYLLLLRRPPDISELPMIASRHPRTALIAIRSGDEYRKQGRRMTLS